MKSAMPKAMHMIAGRPMLRHLLASCEEVFDRIAVVVAPGMEPLARAAAPHAVAIQAERLGTAHAALQALAYFGDGHTAVLYADNPLIAPPTLRRLVERRAAGDVGLALLAMRLADPGRYGRVVEEDGYVGRIVEWADASPAERSIGLCNAGVMCGAASDMARWLRAVRNHNSAGEYYLTDIVALCTAEGGLVATVEAPAEELAGVNSRAELAVAEAIVQRRLRAAAMESGVTMTDPASVFLSADTRFGTDVTLGPSVVFGPGVTVASGVEIRAFSHLEGCTIAAGAVIGPFARIRPGSAVGEGAHVGNFVELKATQLGAGAKANHLSYLGDAAVGARSNIGAGTITCNYDGAAKHRTTIGADAFVGSDAILVAPVTIGDGAFVAAGSVITRDVAPDALALGRARQEDKPGRAADIRARTTTREKR